MNQGTQQETKNQVRHPLPLVRHPLPLPRLGILKSSDRLKLLETVLLELESPAVLGHVANELLRGTIGEDHLDVEGDLNLGADDAGEMAQNLETDLGGVIAGPDGVEFNGSMEPPENRWEGQRRRHAASGPGN